MSTNFLHANRLRRAAQQGGFRVKSLAAEMDVDVRTLQRWFGQQLSTTPKAWLIQERMTAALPLLARGISNKEVAAFLGYSNSPSFGRDFRIHFGCTPQEYRSRMLGFTMERMSRFDHSMALPSVWRTG